MATHHHKAVFLDFGSLNPHDLDIQPLLALKEQGIELVLHDHTAPSETIARLQDATIAISNKVILDADVLHACPSLRFIAIAATGTNNVDSATADKLGIRIANVKGYGTHAVAQHTFSLILALSNCLFASTRDTLNGLWSQSSQFCLMNYKVRDLQGATLGLIGYGELGQAVAKLAEAFGMRVLIAEGQQGPAADRTPLAQLFAESDVISLHTLLTPATEKMINSQTLAQMKQGALLINTARGGLIDEAALKDALVSNHLGGAALDVLSVEPPPNDHILLDTSIPNLIITPHCAWISPGARQRLLEITVANINHFLKG